MPAPRTVVFALGAVLSGAAAPAADRLVDKTLPFQVDKWYELDAKEGPVTVHRLRVERGGGGLKTKMLGPSEYQVPLTLDLEYSNAASHDWKASVRVEWLDDDGEIIDGFNERKEFDDAKQFEHLHASLTTLRYGVGRARKLRITIAVDPD
jgi:hypothetical protein